MLEGKVEGITDGFKVGISECIIDGEDDGNFENEFCSMYSDKKMVPIYVAAATAVEKERIMMSFSHVGASISQIGIH